MIAERKETMKFSNLLLEILTVSVFVLSSMTMNAEDTNNKDKNHNPSDSITHKAWTVSGPLGKITPVEEKDNLDELHIVNVADRKTISSQDHASLGSPFLSLIYADRIKKSDFLMLTPYEAHYLSPNEIIHHNTKKPLSRFSYVGGGPSNRSDRCVSGLFSVSANKKFNIGAYGDWVNSYGTFESSSTRNCNAGFFSTYLGDKTDITASISFSKYENYENGGVADENMVTHPEENGNIAEENIPVNLPSNTFNKFKGFNMYLNYKRHLGRLKLPFVESSAQDSAFADSVAPQQNELTMTKISPVSLIFDAKFESDWKRYTERAISESHNKFYGIDDSLKFRNLNNKQTLDSVLFRQFKTNIGLNLNEEFNKVLKFGFAPYFALDLKSYHYSEGKMLYRGMDEVFLKENKINTEDFTDSMGYMGRPLWAENQPLKMGIGANLSKHSGSHFFYDLLGEYYFLDEKKTGSSFLLSGTVSTLFDIKGKMPVSVDGHFSLENKCPDFFEDFYYSNYLSWSNDFDNKREMKISGDIKLPKIGLSGSVGYVNLGNYIYFDKYGLPNQSKDAQNIFYVKVREDLKLWWLRWNNEICYQATSDDYVLPLPSFSWYSNFYIQTPSIFKKSLTMQIGVDCRYYSKYYAQGYMPATGMFCSQHDKEYGGYPLLNAYASAQLKILKMFIVWNHLNREMGDNRNYIASPGYPMSTSFIRMGISVEFDD